MQNKEIFMVNDYRHKKDKNRNGKVLFSVSLFHLRKEREEKELPKRQ
jgi:hypothetical protein